MKKIILLFILPLFCLYACNNSETKDKKQDAEYINIVTAFIQSALKSDYDEARKYMLKDTINEELMTQVERLSASASPEEKKGLAAATIHIFNTKKVNDTSYAVIYDNSFKKNKDTLLVIKQGENWLVDLKYLFTHDNDSLWAKPLQLKDSTTK